MNKIIFKKEPPPEPFTLADLNPGQFFQFCSSDGTRMGELFYTIEDNYVYVAKGELMNPDKITYGLLVCPLEVEIVVKLGGSQ